MEEGKNNEKKNDKFNLPKVYPVYKKNIRRKKKQNLITRKNKEKAERDRIYLEAEKKRVDDMHKAALEKARSQIISADVDIDSSLELPPLKTPAPLTNPASIASPAPLTSTVSRESSVDLYGVSDDER